MQQTSELYKRLVSVVDNTVDYTTETSLVIGTGEPDNGYKHDMLMTLKTTNDVLGSGSIGKVAVGEIDIEMRIPDDAIPYQAVLRPYIRVVKGTEKSEWLPKGEFLLDTRKPVRRTSDPGYIKLHGYDRLITAQQEYIPSGMSWPATDIQVVSNIAYKLGIVVDPRTTAIINRGYSIPEPLGYACEEILGYIAAMYGGSFCIGDNRMLLLVQLKGGGSA